MSTKDQRRNEWIARIAEYKASGLTMSAWCSANNRSVEQLKYWLRKLKSFSSSSTQQVPSPQWVPLNLAPSVASANLGLPLVVRVGQASIELYPGFNPQLLREIVQALESSC
ncbi:IS66 family insertion sequence element accessory protein TnpA [Paenibacillus ferrarius]|uniref:IS66 family insertion sequence element accessory protein TnpA n=1 Tax=Paenibacillus ferrarius TaxID=1469647 RepID=UPI003D29E492